MNKLNLTRRFQPVIGLTTLAPGATSYDTVTFRGLSAFDSKGAPITDIRVADLGVPEPGAAWMLAPGMILLAYRRRRSASR